MRLTFGTPFFTLKTARSTCSFMVGRYTYRLMESAVKDPVHAMKSALILPRYMVQGNDA
jgi:hypothetical protein